MPLSAWSQEIIDHLTEHMDNERDALTAYGELAERTRDERVRTLVRQILDDEVRHHQQFAEMRDALRAEAEQRAPRRRNGGTSRQNAVALRKMTDQLLELEHEDLRELRRLAKRLRQVEDTAWWSVVVEAMAHDTRKHVRLLEGVRSLVDEAASRDRATASTRSTAARRR